MFIEVVGHNPALVRGTFAALTKIPIADTPAIFEKRPPLLVVRDMSERAAARARLALEAAGALVHVREGDPAEDPELNPPPKQFPTTGSYLVLESGRSNPRLITALRELGGGLDLRTTISIVMEAPSLIPAPAAKTDEEEQRAQALCDEIEAAGGKVRLVGNWHDLA